MKRVFKSLAVIVGLLLGLLLIAVLALVLLFDPDMFKPRIEALAREHQIVLDINGDMSWQLWPALGIEINDLRAATMEAPQEPIAQLGQASLLLAIKPLLHGEVVIHHLLIDGAVINLTVDAEGKGNWEPLLSDAQVDTAATTTPPTTAPSTPKDSALETDGEKTQLQLAVERISLRNSALHYVSYQTMPEAAGSADMAATGDPQRLSLQDLQLEIEQFNLQGKAFTLAMQWRITANAGLLGTTDSVIIDGDLSSVAQLPVDMNALDIRDGRLTLAVKDNNHGSQLSLQYDLALKGLQEKPHYTGRLVLAPLNPKQWLAALGQTAPQTARDDALTSLALTATLSGDSNSLALKPFTAILDDTHFEGEFSITDLTRSAVELMLKGDNINVDHYLAPAEAEEVPAEAPAASGDDILIPLDTLKPLAADISVDFEQLTIAAMPLKQLRLRLEADDGLITLERFSADLYEGTLVASGSLNARTDTAVIEFESGVQGVQLEPLMRDQQLDQSIGLTGAINAAAEGTTRGLTLNQLIQAANGEANFAGAEVRISPLNVEQQFCQIVNLVNKTDTAEKSWPEYTEMDQLSGQINLVEGKVTIEQFAAGVEHLAVSAEGEINLFSGGFDITLPLTLTESSTSETGCRVQSDFWLDRNLSLLRCRGSLKTLNPTSDCRQDSEGLKSLTKDFAAYKLQQQYGEEIEAAEKQLDEKKEELRDKLQEELGGEEGKKLEDRLKGLFRR